MNKLMTAELLNTCQTELSKNIGKYSWKHGNLSKNIEITKNDIAEDHDKA